MNGQMRIQRPTAPMILGLGIGFLFGAMMMSGGNVLAGHRAESSAQMNAPTANDAQHAALGRLTGEWDRTIKFVGQQGAMAQPSSGTCTFSVELGGRFIVEKSHDVVFGRPVDGLRIYGYNEATGQYEMARMYTMSNGITLMKGASNDGGKSIDFHGETGTGGGKSMAMRALFRQTDEDHFSVTMATVGADGKNTPFQETDYARKK
jgi:hypothetical protein